MLLVLIWMAMFTLRPRIRTKNGPVSRYLPWVYQRSPTYTRHAKMGVDGEPCDEDATRRESGEGGNKMGARGKLFGGL